MSGLRPLLQSPWPGPPFFKALGLAAGLLLPLAAEAAGAPEPILVRLGTANITGVYFPVGVALCRIVNQHRPETGVRCSATQTAGSVANVAELRDGDLDLAIVQSDTQADAVTGKGRFTGGEFGDMRAIFALYPEALALVTREGSGITQPEDLAGRKVWRGADGSGTRTLADAATAAYGLSPESFAPIPDVSANHVGAALCAGDIDAFFYAAGQPTPAVTEAALGCAARLVALSGPRVDALVAGNPGLIKANIPGGMYPGISAATPTFGVGATLVTRADASEDGIHRMVAEVFEDFEMLRGLEPVLADLDPAEMTAVGLTAPLHPGAERYFRERGWLP